MRRTLAALGRGVGQPVKLTELATDIAGSDAQKPAKETVSAYLDALDRLKLTENSPSRRPHMRSRTRLREASVRYFVDPSLGTASLGAALVVVTATGGGGKRPDGVHIVPITALGE